MLKALTHFYMNSLNEIIIFLAGCIVFLALTRFYIYFCDLKKINKVSNACRHLSDINSQKDLHVSEISNFFENDDFSPKTRFGFLLKKEFAVLNSTSKKGNIT